MMKKISNQAASLRQLFQDLVAPELREHRAELSFIRGEFGARFDTIDSKIHALDDKITWVNKNTEDKIAAVNKNVDDKIAAVNKNVDEKIAAVNKNFDDKIAVVNGRVEALNDKIDDRIATVNNKIEALDTKFDDKIEGVNRNVRSEIEGVRSEMRAGFSALGAALENAVLRGELSTTREIADLRVRVERLERDRQQPQLSQ